MIELTDRNESLQETLLTLRAQLITAYATAKAVHEDHQTRRTRDLVQQLEDARATEASLAARLQREGE